MYIRNTASFFFKYIGCGGICLTWNMFVLRQVSHNLLDTEKQPICDFFFLIHISSGLVIATAKEEYFNNYPL